MMKRAVTAIVAVLIVIVALDRDRKELGAMEKLNPKSEEWKEMQAEESFLRGK
ncbi:MAG TPA: hypothetical protein VJ901_02365 [Thermoanaerobaculia bacterium]|nr:hypothetical protein [Thermoanaerobaculia bacterium]